ncbi:LysM domain protein [Bombardia bombarda]|uniref:LysM domain protein n=1 Tax=Bombardia bombarda TaxID=252184 RepID=A0AA39XAS6_9PEZI|nr:LysM domain protein [Bombardia bombarda]
MTRAGYGLAGYAAVLVSLCGGTLAAFSVIPSGTVANTSTAVLTAACVSAIEAPIQCDTYLQLLASTDTYSTSNNASQALICTTGCSSSLTTYISTAETACKGQPQAWAGLPYAYYGKVLQSTYNMTCLKDATTGVYCTTFVLGFGNATAAELTTAQACSSCMISMGRQMQSTSYSNYDADLAAQWKAVQARCGTSYPTAIAASETNVTEFTGYAPANYSTSTTCWSGNTYTVVSGDTCGGIAVSKGVATGSLVTLNNILPACTNLQIGQVLCLPETCTVYVVRSGDTCFSIAKARGITFTQILSFNPSINPTCTNLIAGTNICVSNPGGVVYNATAIAGAKSTQTGSYATATVSLPGAVASGTTAKCGKFYQVAAGDYCEIVALKNNIDLALFQAINPSINAACSNLILASYYCVWPLESWNQTLPAATVYTTAAAPAATASGTSGACYTWYVVKSGDTCNKITATYGITMDTFIAWNSAVNAACTNIIAGNA